jgi:type VI secretion system secreted protein Hcp
MPLDNYLVFPEASGTPTIGDTAQTNPSLASSYPNAGVIEVTSFEFAVENTTTIGSPSGGAGAGKTDFDSLVISRTIDKASPVLFSLAAAGHVFESIQMYVRLAGATPVTVIGYEFGTVVITKIDWAGTTGADAFTETLTLECGSVTMAFQPRNADGTAAAPVAVGGWNRVENIDSISEDITMT